jgi:acetoin utilization protein AcuB
MSSQVKSVRASDSAETAWNRLSNNGIHHLVVMDGKNVVGVVSERDLGGARGAKLRQGAAVSDLMARQPVTAKPTHTIRQAANLMRGRSIGCLPVLDDGKLKGIVTVTDLLELLGRGLERPIPRTERAVLSRRHGKYKKTPTRPRD